MERHPTRRRFLSISAVALALPATALADASVTRWTGAALGAEATILLAGVEHDRATAIFAAVDAEVSRLENIFSLYRRDSILMQLNRAGRLGAPPPELLELLNLSGVVNSASGGAFDPTIQPLWRLYADAAGAPPAPSELNRAIGLIGWNMVRHGPDEIRFTRPGMALTLNGIAQGYIADRIAELMREMGLRDVLIDMGEVAARGHRPDGRAWQVEIARPDSTPVRRVGMSDRALATSAPLGTLLGRIGGVGHILDPRTGRPGGQWRLISVSAESAALADGLSTAFCLMPRTAIDRALAAYPDARLEAIL